jgi:hypothetical protein
MSATPDRQKERERKRERSPFARCHRTSLLTTVMQCKMYHVPALLRALYYCGYFIVALGGGAATINYCARVHNIHFGIIIHMG